MTESRRGFRTVLLRAGLALTAPALMGLYAARPMLAFLPYVALVPWVLLYADDRHPRVSLWYYSLTAYLGWPLLYPAGFRFGWFAPFVVGLVLFVPMLVFAPLLRRIHHTYRLPRVLAVPLVWVAVEWLRATFTTAHFDLFRLGYSQAKFPILVQVADVTGVYGISFLVAAVNGLLADLFFALRDNGWAPRRLLGERRLLLGAAALAVAFVAVGAYGAYRLATYTQVEGPRLAVVQPNLKHSVTRTPFVHMAQVAQTDRAVGPDEADLIVWPENAILDDLWRDDAYLDDLGWLAREKGALLLVGAMGRSPNGTGKPTNTAFLIDAEGSVVGRYDKQVLFPWSEYVPLDDLLRRIAPSLQRLQRTLARIGWGSLAVGEAGDGMTLLSMPWNGEELKFAALICVENTYPPVPAEAGRMGARFFVNITSEGTIGGPLQEQLLRICILRAVENRIAYVRAGNTGISGFIDPSGRIQSVLRGDRGGTIEDAGVLIDRVAMAPHRITLYVRSRDALAKLCLALTLGLWLWSLLRGRRRPLLAAAGVVSLLAAGCGGVPALGDDPAASRAALLRARGLAEREPPACREAIPELAVACGDPSSCAEALPYLGDCLMATRRVEIGAELFARVAERHPELEGRSLGYRGFFLERSGYFEQALRAFRRSLELDPAPAVHRMLASLQYRLGDRSGAIATSREGLRLAPDDVGLLMLLGENLLLEGALGEARTAFERVLAVDPGHGQAWVDLGRLRAAEGDLAGAREAYRRAAALDPRSLQARFFMAKLALRENRRDELDTLLRQMREIETSPGH